MAPWNILIEDMLWLDWFAPSCHWHDNDNSTKKHLMDAHFQRGGTGSERLHHLPEAAQLGRDASEPEPRSVQACM